MVQLKRTLTGRHVDSGLIVALPIRRSIDGNLEVPVKPQLTGGNALGIKLNCSTHRFRRNRGIGKFRVGGG